MYTPILRKIHSVSEVADSKELRFIIDFLGADGEEYVESEYSLMPDDRSGFVESLQQFATEERRKGELAKLPSHAQLLAAQQESDGGLGNGGGLGLPSADASTVTLYKLKRAFVLGANIYDFDSWIESALEGIISKSERALLMLEYKALVLSDEVDYDSAIFSDLCLSAAGMSRKSFDALWALAKKA